MVDIFSPVQKVQKIFQIQKIRHGFSLNLQVSLHAQLESPDSERQYTFFIYLFYLVIIS